MPFGNLLRGFLTISAGPTAAAPRDGCKLKKPLATTKVTRRLRPFYKLFWEILRYGLVGGISFLIDSGTLFLFQTFVFEALGATGVYISTAIGFLTGLVFNYIFSILFVFENGREKTRGGARAAVVFFTFAVIGLIGLGLTELGMFAGIQLVGIRYYLAVKVVVAALVLAWNYLARKIIIFH